MCSLDVGHEEAMGQGRLQWLLAVGRRWLPFTEMWEAEEGQAGDCRSAQRGVCSFRDAWHRG